MYQHQQAQHIANLHHHAATCSGYLGQTNRGAIPVGVRHGSIYAMRGLSTALVNEQALTTNLRGQLALADTRINQLTNTNTLLMANNGKLQAEIDKLRAQNNTSNAERDEERKRQEEERQRGEENERQRREQETKNFEESKRKLEEERANMAESYAADLEEARRKYIEDLAKAQAETERAKEAKRNSNRLLRQLLSFTQTQPYALKGYLKEVHFIEEFDFSLIQQLIESLTADVDLEFRNDAEVMDLIEAFENHGLDGQMVHNIQPPLPFLAPGHVEEVNEE